MIWNIISLTGTILGVIGTIVSIITMHNTNRIEDELTKARMSASFKSEYNYLRGNLNLLMEFIEKKDIRYETTSKILKIVKSIKNYSDTESWKNKQVIDDCVKFIEENYDDLTKNVSKKVGENVLLRDEQLNNELSKHLIDVYTELTKEGINHDIGQNRT